MSLFDILASDLIVHIISNWIHWNDLVNLDNALCNSNMRRNYVLMARNFPVRISVKIRSSIEVVEIKTLESMNSWLRSRNIQLTEWQSSISLYRSFIHSKGCESSHIKSVNVVELSELSLTTQASDSQFDSVLLETQLPRLSRLKWSSPCSTENNVLKIHSIRPYFHIFSQLVSLSLDHFVLDYDTAKYLAQSLTKIQFLTVIGGSDVIKAFFVDCHLVQLISFRLVQTIENISDDVKEMILANRDTHSLPNLQRCRVDLDTLLSLAPLISNVSYIDTISFSYFIPFHISELDQLSISFPHLRHLSLDLHMLSPDSVAAVIEELTSSVFPSLPLLSYLYLKVGKGILINMWPVLESIAANTRYLRTLRFVHSKTDRGGFMSSMFKRITMSQWDHFWATLCQANVDLSHVEVDSLPINASILATHALNLKTLILKNTTSGQPSTQQSILLRCIGNFPSFARLVRFHVEDDHLTDDIAMDCLQSIAHQCDQPSGIRVLKKLVVVSKNLTNHVLQRLLYLPDSFAHHLKLLVISAELKSLQPLLLRVCSKYSPPNGSLQFFALIVEASTEMRNRAFSTLSKELNSLGVLQSAVPVLQHWQSYPSLIIADKSQPLGDSYYHSQFPFRPQESPTFVTVHSKDY